MNEIIEFVLNEPETVQNVLTVGLLMRFYVFLFASFMAVNLINMLHSNMRKI